MHQVASLTAIGICNVVSVSNHRLLPLVSLLAKQTKNKRRRGKKWREKQNVKTNDKFLNTVDRQLPFLLPFLQQVQYTRLKGHEI